MGVGRDEIIERVIGVVRELGIESLITKNPNELSGGQRQKVAFASILAMDADFLVIDEPTSQLDPESSEAIFAIIRRLKERGTSIVLVEHKIDLIAEYADRVVVMNAGTITAEGPAVEILTSTALADAGVPYPEVTQIAMRLADAGRGLQHTPITREDAHLLIQARTEEAADVHFAQ
jgi:energy-coupling factor transport system ATP-binding protein